MKRQTLESLNCLSTVYQIPRAASMGTQRFFPAPERCAERFSAQNSFDSYVLSAKDRASPVLSHHIRTRLGKSPMEKIFPQKSTNEGADVHRIRSKTRRSRSLLRSRHVSGPLKRHSVSPRPWVTCFDMSRKSNGLSKAVKLR